MLEATTCWVTGLATQVPRRDHYGHPSLRPSSSVVPHRFRSEDRASSNKNKGIRIDKLIEIL